MSAPLSLDGLVPAPAQVWRGVRLVPLLREVPVAGLRLGLRRERAPVAVVDRLRDAPNAAYVSYIPHAVVAQWTNDGSEPVLGTRMAPTSATLLKDMVRVEHRLVRREGPRTVRMLPLHMAVEGLLAVGFKPPTMRWDTFTSQFRRHGLADRAESFVLGRGVADLEEALRVFELHPQQCGVLLFVGDVLFAALVVPDPRDYGDLHVALVEDLYADLILRHAALPSATAWNDLHLDEARVHDLVSLRAEVARARASWASFHLSMADDLIGRPVVRDELYRLGRWRLSRFRTDMAPDRPNHLGEVITDEDGRVAHLHTTRLSAAQSRRAWLLSRLVAVAWSLERFAADEGRSLDDVVRLLDDAGLAWILRPELLHAAGRTPVRGPR